nr:tetratricopeptide repeat protein [uncultured Selenomonas sp.]
MPEGKMKEEARRLLARAALAALLVACAGTLAPPAAPAARAAAAQDANAPAEAAARKDAAAPAFVARPHFAAELPAAVNEKAAAEVRFSIAEPLNEPILEEEAPPESVEILGAAEATPEQMTAFIRRRNPQPKLACSVEEIVRLYYEEAAAEGVRADIALCQALKETGFFAYGGDVLPEQNNYCGLGATGNKAKGAYFATPQQGVRAHIQHLMAYATTERPHAPLVDPRYDLVRLYRSDIYGKIRTWTGLNGVWAVPGTSYGQDILLLHREATTPDASDASLAFAEKKLREKKDAAAYVYRAIVLAKRGENDRAAADLATALRLSPKSAAALYDRALFFAAAGDEKRAKDDLEALLRAHPDFAYAWYNLGVMNLKAGRNDAAMRDFERALALVPQSANARSNIGVALVREKKYQEAWRAFAQAAEINTANPTVLQNQIVFAACLKE